VKVYDKYLSWGLGEDGGWGLVAGVWLLSSQFLLIHWIIEDKLEI
jgi:hypothetical protein